MCACVTLILLFQLFLYERWVVMVDLFRTQSDSYLVGEVPHADGGVITGGDADLFSRMRSQTADSPPCVAVQQQVGCCILLPDFNDLPVLCPHQDLSLNRTRNDMEVTMSWERRRTTG